MHILIVVLALAAGGVIAHLHVASQSYQAIVRVEGPDGTVYTATLDPVAERRACGAASHRFLKPLANDCPECRVIFARCRREGEGLPAFVHAAEPGPDTSFLDMPGVRIRIDAPQETARRNCEWMEESVHRLGVVDARCVAAAPAGTVDTTRPPSG